jgi:protein involved in polysaccharide export with SLBB domain
MDKPLEPAERPALSTLETYFNMEGVVNRNPSRTHALALLIGFLVLSLAGCLTSDDARVLQVLNERGFGRRYSGNANEVFYYGIGDSIKVKDKFNPELRGVFKIAMDGTVNFPQLGETYVAGLTSKEIAAMLTSRFQHYYKYVQIEVTPGRVMSKKIYIHLDTDLHYIRRFTGDMTLFDVIQSVRYDRILVDLGNVRVIRADPVHPLVIYCDMDSMIHGGNSRDNILIKEDDIIFFTPSIIGRFRNLTKMLVAPLTPLVQLFTAINRIDYMYNTFGDVRYGAGRYGGRYYGY